MTLSDFEISFTQIEGTRHKHKMPQAHKKLMADMTKVNIRRKELHSASFTTPNRIFRAYLRDQIRPIPTIFDIGWVIIKQLFQKFRK